MSGDEIVVLIPTTALPSWSATLITADSSVTLLVTGASGPMPPPPTVVGVTLIKRGATRIVAAVPARAPTSALITTIPSMPIRRRGVAGLSTGTGDRGGRTVAPDPGRGELGIAVVARRRQYPLATQGPHELVLGRIENRDRDLGRPGSLYGFAAVGTPSSTLRRAWAAPSKPAVSTGTTSLAFSLLANFESVSSCRMETRIGSGAASLIAW